MVALGQTSPDLGVATLNDPYSRFYRDVAAAQLASWLPSEAALIVVDLSRARGRFAAQIALDGHSVIHVVPHVGRGPICAAGVTTVAGDDRDLSWLADSSVDAVLAEGGALCFSLAAEETVAAIARVLKPGGYLLVCVESLVLGLSRLAEQGRWAELADAPSADVVLVPRTDGVITRCFWPEELRQLLIDAGFDVAWIRPRSVLPQAVVEKALADEPQSMPMLVRTEMSLAAERESDPVGIHLVASARRR
ncbi:MAG: Methyltransferase type 11 [Frankiales bacterium]|nr:Methyltransferase type 11 [Frankiales bacterium]